MHDFTFSAYRLILDKIIEKKISSQTFQEFIFEPSERAIILRHDIDRAPENALKIAQLEYEFCQKGTYYFRGIRSVFKEKIISRIANLGHEIGYHYEEMDLTKGDHKKAIELFKDNLERFRKLYQIKTICMHGSPMSKYDNRDLWKKYNYRDYGIIGEPYFDIDFNEVLYLSDTGRAWNASGGNVRDLVQSKYNYNFKSAFDIIEALEKNELPDKILLNVHPQRWNDKLLPWAKELVWQNIKNVVKKSFF